MKKILCIALSLIMTISCFGVVAGATGGSGFDFNDLRTNTGSTSDIDLLAESSLSNFNYLGLDINFLYHSVEPLNWAKLSVSWSDIALLKGNINSYLTRVFQDKFSRTKLYCGQYATAICNFIGHLFYTDFVDKKITFDNDFAQIDEFYEVICEQSGLTKLFTEEICPKYGLLNNELNYEPLLVSLGVNLNDLPAPARDIKNGKRVAELLVKSIIDDAISQGPLNVLLNIIVEFSDKYTPFFRNTIKAMFVHKINAGYISSDELNTFKGLLNLIFNNNNPKDNSKLQFLTVPGVRLGVAVDDTELFLYVLAYLRIICMYGNNNSVISSIQSKINSLSMFDSKEKARINKFLDIIFRGTLADIDAFLEELQTENIEEVKNSIWYDFSTFFARILESITQFFDRFFGRFSKIFG